MFQRSKKLTSNFDKFDPEIIRENPQILKILRLSISMPIHQFERTFGMYQESRYERGLYKPNEKKIRGFLKKFDKYKERTNFKYKKLLSSEQNFLEKTKAGKTIGKKTLFRTGDSRTIKYSRMGAKLGGLSTVNKFGQNHMALLSKQIKRGRNKNKGFRSYAEMLVAQALDEINIDYDYEKPVNGLLPDFQLNEKRILEVMCYSTKQYWENQKRRINILKDFEILIVTNNLKFFDSMNKNNIKVIKFSKSVNVLKNRLKVAL